MKQFVIFLVAALSVLGCGLVRLGGKVNSLELQQGDLLFQDLDRGPLCDAIERVTTGYRGMDFSHVGIVALDDNGALVVIEARQAGVKITPLQDFLDRSTRRKVSPSGDAQNNPKVVVARLKQPYHRLIEPALKEARALVGKPYDKAFVIGNDSYYCSELIYEIFLRANNNKPVFTLQPMTFKDPDTGVILDTWEDYFSELGVAVPQGLPGINPGAISRSPALTIIPARLRRPSEHASYVPNPPKTKPKSNIMQQ
jgi:hypothetical protein